MHAATLEPGKNFDILDIIAIEPKPFLPDANTKPLQLLQSAIFTILLRNPFGFFYVDGKIIISTEGIISARACSKRGKKIVQGLETRTERFRRRTSVPDKRRETKHSR